MAAPNVFYNSDLLWRALQQKALQAPRGNTWPAPDEASDFNSATYDTPQGGLIGRLIELQASQSRYRPDIGDSGPAPSGIQDPDFRQLSKRIQSQTSSDR